jgi:hypothetical protein
LQHFFDWARRRLDPLRPWLILGKGPSFARRARFDLSVYDLLSLNHAVREQPVRLAHLIDLDVVNACGAALLSHARHVVLPWYPHVRNAPGTRSLDELVRDHALLRRLAQEGRLLWYDLSIAPRRHGPGPVVQATYFSAEAAVSMLALAGVRQVRSLGVDGGAGYSTQFEDLAQDTLLANGQPAFDLQFAGIARTILETGLDFAPLDQPSPVSVLVLSAEPAPLPERVLEFSLRKHTSMSVAIRWIGTLNDVESGCLNPPDQGHVAGLQRMLLLRSDALVVDDLRTLWSRPLARECVAVPAEPVRCGAPGTTSIALVTADPARTDAAILAAARLLAGQSAGASPTDAAPVEPSLPATWNTCDGAEEGTRSLLSFAAPPQRPWVSRAHPLAHRWVATLIDAVQAGFVSLDLVRTEVRLGRVRPSLLEQVERGNPESLLVSRAARRLDAAFVGRLGAGTSAEPAPHPLRLFRAFARQARRRVRAYRRRHAAPR